MSLLAAVDSLRGILGLGGSTDATVRNLFRWSGEWEVDTATGAAAVIVESPAHRCKQKGRLIGCSFTPQAAVTGAATNFFSIIGSKRLASNPATKSVLFTYPASSTPAGDAAAYSSKDMLTLVYLTGGVAQDANSDFLEGDMLTFEVTKSGTGMVTPIFNMNYIFEARD